MSTDSTSAEPRSWLTGGSLNNPFATPRGRGGRLAGCIMGRGNADEQTDVLRLLAPEPGERVLEVGYGPGVLVELLLAAGADVAGVDPSALMRDQARHRVGRAVEHGRVASGADLRVGTAENTGFPDVTFDAVVSVNTIAMWTDLPAGLRELRRVLKRGGRLVLAWHGGTQPSWLGRRLALPDQTLRRVEDAAREVFDDASRHDLPHVVAFTGVRPIAD